MSTDSSPRPLPPESLRRGLSRRWRRSVVWLQRWSPWTLLVIQAVFAAWLMARYPLASGWGATVLAVALGLAAVGAATVRVGERSSLGLAALLVPTIVAAAGVVVAGLLMVGATILSDRLLLYLESRFPDAPPERRWRSRRIRDRLALLVATLFAGAALSAGWGTVRGLVLASLCLVLSLSVHECTLRWAYRDGHGLPSGPWLDGLWFVLGGAILEAVGGAGRIAAINVLPSRAHLGSAVLELVGLLAAVGLLAVLALGLSAQQRRTAYLTRRLSVLDAIGSAPRRLGSPRRRQPDVVVSAVEEIRRVVDFDFLQLDLAGPGGAVWSAARGQPPLPQPARPPRHPPPRPGIHRRRDWIVQTRELLSGSQELGTLRIWCDPRRHDARGLDLLDHLSEQVAALLERSLLAREARFDRLTGLPRRGIFDDELERRWREARSSGRSLAVVLLDIDHFKAVNDTHGHPVGDQALVHVANLLSRVMRDEDLCCRYGGEEFVLLLRDADGGLALEMAERARRVLERTPLDVFASGGGNAESLRLELTLSAGAAAVPELLLAEPAELLQLADEALYAAKEGGRNRSLLAAGAGRYRAPGGRIVATDERVASAPVVTL